MPALDWSRYPVSTASPEIVPGKNIRLRLARPTDAAFILSLRLDPTRNRFVSTVPDDAELQAAWLTEYQLRESQGLEYYFIIERGGGQPAGTVRLYDFQGDSFCWGSWMMVPDTPPSVAMESALLVYELAFYNLGFCKSHFEVQVQNERVIAFHKRFGARITHSTALDHFFTYGKEDYEAIRSRFKKFLPDWKR